MLLILKNLKKLTISAVLKRPITISTTIIKSSPLVPCDIIESEPKYLGGCRITASDYSHKENIPYTDRDNSRSNSLKVLDHLAITNTAGKRLNISSQPSLFIYLFYYLKQPGSHRIDLIFQSVKLSFQF